MSIEALYQTVEQSRIAWNQVYDYLVSAKYEVSSPRSNIGGLTVEQLHRRALLVIETFLAIQPKDERASGWTVLVWRAAEITPTFTNFKNHAEGINNQIRPHLQEGVDIRDGNNNFTFNLFLNGANTFNSDFSGYFQQIHSSVTTLLAIVSTLLPFSEAKNVGDLSNRAQALADVIRETEALRNEARKLAKATEQSAAHSANQEKAIQDLFTKAETALSQLQALQVQGNTDAGNVAALIEKVKSIASNADTLEKQVENYKSTFEAFQASLDKRNADFSQFEINTKAAEEANIKRDSEINRLTKLADSMISGATTAGLAKSMEDARHRYEERMNGARKGFYLAVVVLVISSLPLVGHLLPGLVGTWFPGLDIKADASPYAAVSKVLLLVPATWLTAFFTKSYADFFHLEREYAHKAALAMSVDGFKRQAQKYEEEITAEVFMEIRANPANKLGVDPASHPLYNVLSNAVAKVLDKKEEVKKV
jgi:hypothetical protein